MKKVLFSAEKSVFCHKKGVIFKLENKDGYHFFQWVREPGEGGGEPQQWTVR